LIGVVIPVVVDIEAVGIEIADIDSVAIRIQRKFVRFRHLSLKVEIYCSASNTILTPGLFFILSVFYPGANLKN